MYSLSGRPAGGSGTSVRAAIAAALASMAAAAARPSASACQAQPLAGQGDPGQVGDQSGAAGERHRLGGPGCHLRQARQHRLARHVQLRVPGREAVPALPAVIPGPADGDRAEHRVHGLVPVGHELRPVPGPAVRPRAPVSPVGGQQRLQQPRAELGQPGAQRHLRGLQPAAGQAAGGGRGQPRYLGGGVGGELRLDLRAEPPLCPSAGGTCPACAGTGRASQIASFTSTICSASVANSW